MQKALAFFMVSSAVLLLNGCPGTGFGFTTTPTTDPSVPGFASDKRAVTITLPAVHVFPGWRLSPTTFVENCGTQRSFIQLDPHERQKGGFASSVCLNDATVIASEFPGNLNVQCNLVFSADGTFRIRTFRHTDTDCRARVRQDGAVGFTYNLKHKYRPPK